ncbi:phosphoenolpyruvate hydrolase family protein [Ruegeria arenilitoris]|uniref:phosphoenolpyruvate hydrolase family protein n=1 Tax=Ruegeria arenilitoris TaxID=1173585 RepID=UPI00147A2C50|nr:phosphoenolpyruvate hydrolase family protein [Ruegeria arenilitoris]
MPRLDHNRVIRESRRQGDWAALLASDPFGSEVAMFRQLYEHGYLGITNWPSSILLDGSLKQSMSTIPASPEFEYKFLARANEAGFRTLAFFLSLDQARLALKSGLSQLVLHPGLLNVGSVESGAMVLGSLQRLIETIKAEAENATIFAYTSEWHEQVVPLSTLDVDGLVWCKAEN